MAISFPASPTDGQEYSFGGMTWVWNDTASTWDTATVGAAGPTGATGPAGPTGFTGPPGNTGVQGVQGNTGVPGNTGVQGATGPVLDRDVYIQASDANGDALTVATGLADFTVPSSMNGMNVKAVATSLTTASSSGLPTVQITRLRAGSPAAVLSTTATIDVGELTSYTAVTQPVVNGSNDDLLTGDKLRVDVTVSGTGAKGLAAIITIGT